MRYDNTLTYTNTYPVAAGGSNNNMGSFELEQSLVGSVVLNMKQEMRNMKR
jgi:hypothetical protein